MVLTASRAAAGGTSSRATAATTASGVAEATTRSSPAKATTRCTPATAMTLSTRDTDGEDYIDCGPGFDKVETIHRDDETLGNCERALGPQRVTSKRAVTAFRHFIHPRSWEHCM